MKKSRPHGRHTLKADLLLAERVQKEGRNFVVTWLVISAAIETVILPSVVSNVKATEPDYETIRVYQISHGSSLDSKSLATTLSSSGISLPSRLHLST